MTTHGTVLVLGGSGKTGRRIVERLRAREIPVRVGSRCAVPAFVWEDRATWGPALAGATAVYVSYYPDIAVPGAPEAVAALARQALDDPAAGVPGSAQHEHGSVGRLRVIHSCRLRCVQSAGDRLAGL